MSKTDVLYFILYYSNNNVQSLITCCTYKTNVFQHGTYMAHTYKHLGDILGSWHNLAAKYIYDNNK